VFFRARTFGRAFAILGSMLGFAQPAAPGLIPLPKVAGVAAFTAVLLGVHWLLRDSSIERAAMRLPWWARSLVLALLMIAIVTMTGEDRAFIYFQF
jgi:alginate O-acetyltransferase complex protein AlgI